MYGLNLRRSHFAQGRLDSHSLLWQTHFATQPSMQLLQQQQESRLQQVQQ